MRTFMSTKFSEGLRIICGSSSFDVDSGAIRAEELQRRNAMDVPTATVVDDLSKLSETDAAVLTDLTDFLRGER